MNHPRTLTDEEVMRAQSPEPQMQRGGIITKDAPEPDRAVRCFWYVYLNEQRVEVDHASYVRVCERLGIEPR